VYFSQRVDRNPHCDMILLDDPIQSMDAGPGEPPNRHGLASFTLALG
jgi:hypothetical protein